MNKLKSFAYPLLQKARYASFIKSFEKAKKELPMQGNKILMYSTSKGKLGGNLLAVKNYIEKNSLPFQIAVAAPPEIPSESELAREMASSRFILVDDYEPLVYVLNLRKGQELVQVWHALGAFKRFGYGRATAEKASLTHKNYTKAIVSSPEISGIYAEAFGISSDKIYPTGAPRTDLFFDDDYIASARKRLYEKEPRLKNKKICLFAPTFRGQSIDDADYPQELFDVEELALSLGNEWAVIIKMHPFIKRKIEIPPSVSDRAFDFADEREINDILFITDVLVTDYSSVIFENAIIGNPAVLYAPDLAEYDKGRGFYFDYSDYSCGCIVQSRSELAPAVLNATADNEQAEKFKKRFISLCDGNSSKRFVEQILK